MDFTRFCRWVAVRTVWRSPRSTTWLVVFIVASAVSSALLLDWFRRARAEADQFPPATPTLSPFYAQLMTKTAPHSASDNWQTRKLEVGVSAPDFTLPTIVGERTVRLSDFQKHHPVVLIFGSFSCNLFCGRIDQVERFYQAHKNEAEFLFVDISEARHIIAGLEFVLEDTTPGKPEALPVRREKIAQAMNLRKLTIPAVIDAAEATVEKAYDAFPLRLVVVNSEGQIALDLGHGMDQPWDMEEVGCWLASEEEHHGAAE
jgi:Iodothyronine deiodinase